MRKKRLHILWKLALVFPVLILFFFAPSLIESAVSGRLDFPGIKANVLQVVKSQTGFEAAVQGIRFDIFQGIVLTGFSLQTDNPSERGKYLFQSENVVLEISLWRLLNKEFPIQSIRIDGGKFQPYLLSFDRWKEMLHPAPKPPGIAAPPGPAPVSGTDIEKLQFEFNNISLILPDQVLNADESGRIETVSFNLTVRLKEDSRLFRLDWKILKRGGRTGHFVCNGVLKKDYTGRFDFHIRKMPVDTVYAMIAGSPILPFSLPSESQVLGTFTGEGSLDLLEKNAAMNIYGAIDEFAFVLSPESGVAVAGSRAGLHYNAGFSLGQKSSSFNRLVVEHEDLNLTTTYVSYDDEKNPAAARKTLETEGEINLTPGEDAVRPGIFEYSGNIKYKINLIKQLNQITVSNIEILATDLAASFPAGIFQEPALEQKKDSVTVNSGSIRGNSASGLKIKMNGIFIDSPFEILGESSLRISPPAGELPAIVSQNADIRIDIHNMSYRKIALPVVRLFEKIWELGTGETADKAEDTGPVWRYRFMDPDIYAGLVKPLTLNAKVRFLDMENSPTGSAAALDLQISARDGQITTSVPDIRTESSAISFHYMISLEPSLPRHELRFTFQNKHNRIKVPEITGSDVPPESVDIDFTFAGDGFLPGDLINRSYSQLTAKFTSGIVLKNQRPFPIIAHSLGLTGDTFALEDFQVYRATDGPKVTYSAIHGKMGEYDAIGSGLYLPGLGGTLRLNYTKVGALMKSGVIGMKILPNGNWIPDAE